MRDKIAWGFFIYVLAMLLWNLAIFVPPVLVASGNMEMAEPFYIAFSFTCHQLDTRSLCYYKYGLISQCRGAAPNQRNIEINSCNPAPGQLCDYEEIGYKLPVCSRDVAIYLMMLIGAFVYPFVRKISDESWPHPRWLILAIIPIALDGGTQFLGLRESTNELRLITGAIIGFVVPFYLIPVMNQIFNSICEDIISFLRKKK